MLTDRLEWCGLWCFYQLFGLSFWRHPFTSIAETVMQWHISPNLMKKQNHPNLGWPEDDVYPWWESDLILSRDRCDSHSSPGRTCAASAPAALSASDWAKWERDAVLSAADADLEAPGACVCEWTYICEESFMTCKGYLCYTITCNPKNAWHPFFCQTYILKCLGVFCPYNGSQCGLVTSFVFCRQVWNDRTVSKWQNSHFWATVPLRWTFETTHMWPWSTKAVISSTDIFVAIANNALHGSKLYIFYFMPKIIRILIKDHVPWRYLVNFLP